MVATNRSPSAAELYYLSPVAFRWPPRGHGFKLHGCFALGCRLQARFLAFFGLAIERLRHRRGPAHLAQQQHFYMKLAAIVGDPQLVAHADLAGGFCGLPIGLNPAQLTCSRGKSARLEEARRPKPFIDSHGRHEGIVL